MPHVVVKMYPGRPDEQKKKLADYITAGIVNILNCGENAVSVGIEEINKEEWPDTVYKPEIIDKKDTLYKKPGYNPFE